MTWCCKDVPCTTESLHQFCGRGSPSGLGTLALRRLTGL
jgi:hypothetical protein